MSGWSQEEKRNLEDHGSRELEKGLKKEEEARELSEVKTLYDIMEIGQTL